MVTHPSTNLVDAPNDVIATPRRHSALSFIQCFDTTDWITGTTCPVVTYPQTFSSRTSRVRKLGEQLTPVWLKMAIIELGTWVGRSVD